MNRAPILAGFLLVALVAGCVGFVAGVNASAPSEVSDSDPPPTVPALRGAPLAEPSPSAAVAYGVVPQPTAELIPAAMGGTATWCAPTPNYCQSWGRPAMLGAMESFRWGDEPYQVRVRFEGRFTVVTVVSHCVCGRTLIDLSIEAFDDLAPLSRGRINVSVEVLGAGPTLPATTTP